MKKALLSFAILAAGLLVASCGKKSAEPAAEAEQTEQTEQVAEETAAAEAEPAVSLADIVAKAKAEGANWSVDEWKSQFKKALEAYKPFAVEMNGAQIDQLEEIKNKYADFPSLMKELMQAAASKGITEEWVNATMKELGIPDL